MWGFQKMNGEKRSTTPSGIKTVDVSVSEPLTTTVSPQPTMDATTHLYRVVAKMTTQIPARERVRWLDYMKQFLLQATEEGCVKLGSACSGTDGWAHAMKSIFQHWHTEFATESVSTPMLVAAESNQRNELS